MPEEIIINNKNNKNDIKLNTPENMEMIIEEDNKPIIAEELKKIFGESFSEIEKNLKKNSLFGKLNNQIMKTKLLFKNKTESLIKY